MACVVNHVRAGRKRSMVTGCHRNVPIVEKLRAQGEEGGGKKKRSVSNVRLASHRWK